MNQLIVPIRDRRQSRRIVTLKNFGRLAIALAVVFAGLTLASEIGKRNSAADYGRLFGKQVGPQAAVAKPKYEVVKEGAVADQTAPDPYLMAPAARAQALGIGLDPIVAAAPPTATVEPVAPAITSVPGEIGAPRAGAQGGVAIIGGSDGVTIVRGAQKRPTLSGGIFKPQ